MPPTKKKLPPKQQTLAQRITEKHAEATPRMPTVVQNLKGIEFREGDKVTVNGTGPAWEILSLDDSPNALLGDGAKRNVVHINALRHFVAPPRPGAFPLGTSVKSPVRSAPAAPAGDDPEPPSADALSKRRVGRPWVQESGPFSIVRIANGGPAEDYLMEVLGSNTFDLTKLRGGATVRYRVRIGPNPLCHCDGFRSHAHCKHVEGLEAIRAASGRI